MGVANKRPKTDNHLKIFLEKSNDLSKIPFSSYKPSGVGYQERANKKRNLNPGKYKVFW